MSSALSVVALYACDSQQAVQEDRDARTADAAVRPDGAPGEVDGGPPGPRFERARPLRAQTLSVGAEHACAVTDTGRLVCWGSRAELGLLDGLGLRLRTVSVGDTRMETGHVSPIGAPAEAQSFGFGSWARQLEDGRWLPAYGGYGYTAEVMSIGNHRGSESHCYLSQGRVNCEAWLPREVEAAEANEPGFRSPPGFWDGLEAASLVPHSGQVGCARRVDGAVRCWASGLSREVCPDNDDGPACGDDHSWYYLPQAIDLPALTAICVAPTIICTGAEGGVDCRTISAQRGDRETYGEHQIGPPVRTYEGRGGVRGLACASNSGPILGEPPYHTRICALDADGRLRCGLDGAPLTPVFDDGPSFVEVETSLWVTCGLTAEGKVRCVRWPDGGDQAVPVLVPGGLTP